MTTMCLALVLVATAAPSAAQYEQNSMTVSTGSVAPGGTFEVRGCCFDPGSNVQVIFNSTPIVLGTLVADSIGAVSGSFAAPAGVELGSHTVQLVGTSGGQPLTLSTAIQVVVGGALGSAVAPPAAMGTDLPRTGSSDTARFTAMGAALVAAGGFFVIASRKRRATA